ncbi:MAG: TetR/AcrR family transcriptional regulator [Rhizobiaceae bacterium]
MAEPLKKDVPRAERGEGFSKRQCEVLDAALDLLVSGDDRLSMSAIARTANCSKETLYNWFGDSDGVLAAIVRRQASKVRMPADVGEGLDLADLRQRLEVFAIDLLTVLTGDMSVALNRLAIGHAGSAKSTLGSIVLENGRFAMGRRLKPLIEAGQQTGLLSAQDNSETLFRTFFGLVVRDVQIRLLLGDKLPKGRASISAEAAQATSQFIQLYSISTTNARIRAI